MQMALIALFVAATRDTWYEALLTDLYGCAQFDAYGIKPCEEAMVSA